MITITITVPSACAGRFLYFACILIIFKETTEGDCNHLLDNIFLVNAFKLAHYLIKIWSNLIFINIGLHYFVHYLIKLFCADFFRLWQFTIDKLLTNLFLNLTNFPLFLYMDNTY